MASIDDLCDYITKEMRINVNSPDARQISLHISSIAGMAQPITYSVGLWRWKELVGARKKWDHKRQVKEIYGFWSFDAVTRYEFNFDIWSNIHYGYLGLSVGFSEGVLKMGAGAAQLRDTGLEPTFGAECKASALELACLPALDDPKDQVAIQIGFDLWKTHGFKLTSNSVRDLVRSRRAELNARRKQT